MRAVIPVKRVKDAKQRLASVLNASERRDLFVAMFEDVLDVVTAVQDFHEVTVATCLLYTSPSPRDQRG